MTRTTNARVAGVTFFVYLAAGITSLAFAVFDGAGNWSSSVTWLTWSPMLVFQVAPALWLLAKGVAAPAPKQR